MTTTENTVHLPDSDTAPPQDYLRILDAIQSGALRLLAGFPQQPNSLRIQVGEVTVEAQWPQAPEQAGTIAAPAPDTSVSAESAIPGSVVRAPSIGVFYRCQEPGAAPFVEIGDRVSAGQQIGIVEAMKLMIPVNAQSSGVITEVLKRDGDAVEYDEPLFAYSTE